MKIRGTIIVIHLIIFIIAEVALLFYAENLLNYFAAGFHDGAMWLALLQYGSLGILILTTISCILFMKRYKSIK